MCGEFEKKDTFDVMIKMRPYTITRVTLYLANDVRLFMGMKGCLCVRHLWFAKKKKCVKLTKICAHAMNF